MIRRTGFAAIFLLLSAGSVQAALQPPITVGGTEWLQPLDFISYSWNAISSVCNPSTGVCSGSLGGNDLTGWTWANISNVNALFNYYLGAIVMGPGPSAASGYVVPTVLAPLLADGFLATATFFDTYDYQYISGWLRTSYNSANAYTGLIGYSSYETEGIFDISYVDTASIGSKLWTQYGTGAWFYRGDINAIPVIDTLALVVLGLFALGLSGPQRRFSPLHGA